MSVTSDSVRKRSRQTNPLTTSFRPTPGSRVRLGILAGSPPESGYGDPPEDVWTREPDSVPKVEENVLGDVPTPTSKDQCFGEEDPDDTLIENRV